jgi:hypothetical protein
MDGIRTTQVWFISKSAKTTDHPTLADTDLGKEIQENLQYDTELKGASHWGLPMVFNGVFQAARVKMSSLSGKQMNTNMYEDVMEAATWEEHEPDTSEQNKRTQRQVNRESDTRTLHMHRLRCNRGPSYNHE